MSNEDDKLIEEYGDGIIKLTELHRQYIEDLERVIPELLVKQAEEQRND